MDEKKVSFYQKEVLRKLLEHCQETVPVYKNLDVNNFDSWPVVNKSILKEGGDIYFSTSFKRESLITMSTSGSTGTPFSCLQNKDKKRHVNAEVLFYNGKIDYRIGRRIIYFRSVVTEVAKSSLQQFMQNIYLLDCQDLSDNGIAQKLKAIKKISKGCGAMILSYASTLDAFRKYFDKVL